MSAIKEWPRLSQTLPGPKDLSHCWACRASGVIAAGQFPFPLDQLKLDVWQEHDNLDKPEPVYLLLCRPCSKQIIGPHPRLYASVAPHATVPGAMPACRACRFRQITKCLHPHLKANGGLGLMLNFPAPAEVHVCRCGSGARSGWEKVYMGAVTCRGREEAGNA